MLNRLIELANQQGLLLGVTSKEKYEKYTELNEMYKYAKSIITFAMPIERGNGIMASYALSKDYHLVLKEKLSYIASILNLKRFDICVDTEPISDKLCALTSGLGFIGKNSLIITSEGSFVMLGEIVTDLELDQGEEVLTSCGTCTLCEVACPSNAIGNVYENCIAGWLQRKIVLTDSQYEMFDTIYGCDICQNVCPFNKGVQTKEVYTYENINILDIIKCSKKEFYKYKEVAFYWLGHNVVKRNIIVYAANKGIDLDSHIQYVNSKEEYMLAAIDYYWRKKR